MLLRIYYDPMIMGQRPEFCQKFKSMRKHLLMCDEYAGQRGNVSAPAQVLNAVKARVWDSSARSFPQRGNSLRILHRSSLLSVEKPCPLSRPRASSPTPFAFITQKTGCPRRSFREG